MNTLKLFLNCGIIASFSLTACGVSYADKVKSETRVIKETSKTPTYKLSLSQSEEMALKYSYALRAARKGKDVAKGKMMSAFSEALPKVTLQYENMRSDTYSKKRDGKSRSKWDQNYTGSIIGTQPLYTGGKAFAAIRAARKYNDYIDETIRLQKNTLLYNVKVTYYQIKLSEELVRVSEEQVRLADKYLDDVKKRRDMETSTDYDVLRAEVEKTNEITQLTAYQNDLVKARTQLLKFLGLPMTSKIELLDDLDYVEKYTNEESTLYHKALAMRPEVRSSKINIDLKKEDIVSTRAGLLPQVNLEGTYYGTAEDADEELNDYAKGWEAGIKVTWAIFDGLAVRGQVKQKKAEKEQLKLKHLDLSNQVRLEVRTALLDIKSARTSVKSQSRNVDQARESLRLTHERERNGVSTYLDVLTARQTLAVAERNYYQSIFDYKSAWASLALAVGTIDEEQRTAKKGQDKNNSEMKTETNTAK
jgi:outer membrane protein TolC